MALASRPDRVSDWNLCLALNRSTFDAPATNELALSISKKAEEGTSTGPEDLYGLSILVRGQDRTSDSTTSPSALLQDAGPSSAYQPGPLSTDQTDATGLQGDNVAVSTAASSLTHEIQPQQRAFARASTAVVYSTQRTSHESTGPALQQPLHSLPAELQSQYSTNSQRSNFPAAWDLPFRPPPIRIARTELRERAGSAPAPSGRTAAPGAAPPRGSDSSGSGGSPGACASDVNPFSIGYDMSCDQSEGTPSTSRGGPSGDGRTSYSGRTSANRQLRSRLSRVSGADTSSTVSHARHATHTPQQVPASTSAWHAQ